MDKIHALDLNNFDTFELQLENSYSDAVVNSVFMLGGKLTVIFCDNVGPNCHIKMEGEADIDIGARVTTTNSVVNSSRAVFATDAGEVKSLSSTGVLTTAGLADLSGKIIGTPDSFIGNVGDNLLYDGELQEIMTSPTSLSVTSLVSNVSHNHPDFSNDPFFIYGFNTGASLIIDQFNNVVTQNDGSMSVKVIGNNSDYIYYAVESHNSDHSVYSNLFLQLDRSDNTIKSVPAPDYFFNNDFFYNMVMKTGNGYLVVYPNAVNDGISITKLDSNFENPEELSSVALVGEIVDIGFTGESSIVLLTSDNRSHLVKMASTTPEVINDFFVPSSGFNLVPVLIGSLNGTVTFISMGVGGVFELVQVMAKE